ncbi:MAG: hypothetical protein QW327_03165 [Candidatus Odinarchaeota archaeon]
MEDIQNLLQDTPLKPVLSTSILPAIIKSSLDFMPYKIFLKESVLENNVYIKIFERGLNS